MITKRVWLSILSATVSFMMLSSCEEELFPNDEETDPTEEIPDDPDENGTIEDSTLVAYYPLDGDAQDFSGYGHHATTNGGEYSSDISGNEEAAFRITAKNNVLDIPDFDQEQISVSLWYYYEGAGSFWNTLLYGKNSHHHLIVSHANGSGTSGEIGTYLPGFKSSGYMLEENKWHHLVLTKDSDASKIYLNGVLVYDYTDFSNAEYPLTVIGNFAATDGTQGALGKLDEIKIYSKVLSFEEVEDLSKGITLDPPKKVGEGEEPEEAVGLIAHYPFDGNTQDESGFENDATAYGGEYANDRFGNANSAFRITTKSDAIDIKDFDQENISVSMWYYYEGTGSFWNTLLYGSSSHHHLIVSHANGSGTAGELGTYTGGFTGSEQVMEAHQWYHLVLTKEGSSTKLYVDKQLALSTQNFSNADYPLTVIGNYTAPNGTQGALGRLDDVKIYDKVLLQDEIDELYGEPFEQEQPPVEEVDPADPGTANLLAYYPFNNNTNDQSGLEQHAIAVGGSFGTDRQGNASSAFVISSKSDALDINDMSSEQISVSMWYYYEGTGSFWNTLLYGGSSKHHLIVSHANGSGEAGELGTYPNGFKGSGKVMAAGNWYHLVLTKDGSSSKLYVDNELVFSTQDFSNADYPLTVIGNYTSTSGTQGALGKLDEIRIYDKVLSAHEVDYLYKN